VFQGTIAFVLLILLWGAWQIYSKIDAEGKAKQGGVISRPGSHTF